MKYKFFTKLFFVLTLTFVLTHYLGREVFIGFTPTFRPNLGRHLVSIAKSFLNKDEKRPQINNLAEAEMSLKSAPFKVIAKGVSAKNRENVSITEYRLDEIEWVEYLFVVKGQQVKIKVPKGMDPPSQKELEILY